MKNNIIYVYVVSLGCSKNFVDTEVMAAALVTHGIGITDNPDEASIFLINTCAFILPAREEAEENIEIALDWKAGYPDGKIIVTGCLTQWDKNKQYVNQYPEVDLWLGIDELTILPEKISALYSETEQLPKTIFNKKPKYLYNDKTPRLQLTPSHYANIKIADGCDNRCAYCSIPIIRGNLRSRRQESILLEAKSLLGNGVKELIIIAQDTTAFGRDNKRNGENLASLLRKLDKIEGEYWIRLHYLYPEGISDELISIIANSKHILPYLDIPLQHISDSVLTMMNRRTSSSQIKDRLIKLRKNIPNLIVRTTFLTGFPGETESDFNELKEFVSEWKFERIGIFPFYPEEGTKAVELPNQIPFEIAEKRSEILYKIHAKNSREFNKNLEGKELDAIIDTVEDDSIIGRTYMDSPDIDNTVIITSNKTIKQGSIIKTRITGSSEFELLGIEI